MLLVIDVGNTNTVLGIYDGESLVDNWRIWTERDRTSDEYGILMRNLFASRSIPLDKIEAISISCVVPPMLNMLLELCEKYFSLKPLVVEFGVNTEMPILLDNPYEVGADRIVNAVAAYHKHRRSLIVVDFGTATTFDYISPRGEYMGGAICPGSGDLRRGVVHPGFQASPGGTEDAADGGGKEHRSIDAGRDYLRVCGTDGRDRRPDEGEVGTGPRVIATGGLAPLIASESKTVDEVDEFLTLEGLRLIYEMNRKA